MLNQYNIVSVAYHVTLCTEVLLLRHGAATASILQVWHWQGEVRGSLLLTCHWIGAEQKVVWFGNVVTRDWAASLARLIIIGENRFSLMKQKETIWPKKNFVVHFSLPKCNNPMKIRNFCFHFLNHGLYFCQVFEKFKTSKTYGSSIIQVKVNIFCYVLQMVVCTHFESNRWSWLGLFFININHCLSWLCFELKSL